MSNTISVSEYKKTATQSISTLVWSFYFLCSRLKAFSWFSFNPLLNTPFTLALIAVGALGYYSCSDAQNTLGSANITNTLLGLAGAFLSVIGWGSEAVVCAWATRKQSADDETILHIRETVSAISYTIIALILCFTANISVSSIFASSKLLITVSMLIAIGLLGTGSYLSYYRGIAQVGASRAMAANVTYAAWGMIASSIIYQTMPSIIAWICCITIMCSTIFVARK
ncbi:EamA family transporter [Gardnerella vaginalis]|uniref:EamA family transporter n=1 Tax=Gardnerella vaginalis TaxID=2702 RepID=UPI0039EED612